MYILQLDALEKSGSARKWCLVTALLMTVCMMAEVANIEASKKPVFWMKQAQNKM